MLSIIKFNNTAIPYLSTWTEAYSVIENNAVTEAGTDQRIVMRAGKLEVSAGGTLLSGDVVNLETFRSVSSFTLTLPSGNTHTVCMRDFQKTLLARSEKLSTIDGIWRVSFKLVEF